MSGRRIHLSPIVAAAIALSASGWLYGLLNKDGRLAMIALWNNDLANFRDWIDEARYPLEPSTEAFRMGVNFVIFAMTH